MFVQKGDVLDYKNAGETAIGYGDVVGLVSRVGVAGEKIEPSATGSVHVVGVFELPAVDNAAFSTGDELYWDATNTVLTKTAEGNIAAGYAFADKAQAGTVAQVKIG